MLRRSTRNVKKSTNDSEETNSSKIHKNFETQTQNNSASSTSSESEEESNKLKNKSPKNKKVFPKRSKCKISDTSSSESDIENYLQPIEKIDLNSSFFDVKNCKEDEPSFDRIEKEIFSGVTVTRLSDSDTSEDEGVSQPMIALNVIAETSKSEIPHADEEELKRTLKEEESIAKLNFQQLQAYEKKLEEAKKSIELYNVKQAKESIEEVKTSIDNIDGLLAAGESKQSGSGSQQNILFSELNASNYETFTDSEQEDWEEIKEEHEKPLVPKKELEITVEMPTTMKKKKGNDLLSAVKRRLNRIRKENQILIHKVHLLCWIAHGNYVNSVLNDESMIALGLSLIPSERCYPAGRIDLDYLEQIIKWYKRTLKLIERTPSENKSLNELLTEQIDKREVYSKKMLVLIFIIILRSLGVQCRLILSLQVEPVRPSGSDLHFLGKSSDSKQTKLKGNKSEYPTSSSEEIKDLKVGIKKEHEISPHFKVNKSDIERSRQDCLGTKKAIVNVERMKLNDSLGTQSKNSPKVKIDKSKGKKQVIEQQFKTNDSSEIERKTSKISSNEARSYDNSKGHLGKKHQIDSKYEKDAIKSSTNKSNITGRLGKMKKDNEKKDHKKRGEKISEKVSNEITERVNSQQHRKMKTRNVHEVESDEKIKGELIKEKRVRSTRGKSKNTVNDSEKTIRSKSANMDAQNLEIKDPSKTRSKSTSSTSKRTSISKRERIPQLDGSDDNLEEFKGFEKATTTNKILGNTSFERFYSERYGQISEAVKTRNSLKIPQLDGTTDDPSTSTPNLKMLRKSVPSDDKCKSKSHRKSTKKINYLDATTSDSDDCFRESPVKKFKAINKGKVVELSCSKTSEKTLASRKDSDSDKKKRNVNLKKLSNMKVESEKKNHSKVMDVTKDIMQLIKGRISEQKHIDNSKMVKKRKSVKYENDSDESDYVPEVSTKKYHSDSDDEFHPKMKVKRRIQIKKEVKKVKKLKKSKDVNSRKVISSDSEYTEEEIEIKNDNQIKTETTKKKKGNDVWLEVFLETEEKWISVDVVFGQVHCVNELYSRATHPVSYVLSWSNTSHLKDITRRYCQNYNTVTRKLRVDSQWWEESLKPFIGPKNARDREEDDELNRQQLEKPLPTTISEYKNHPLYALERHLLKFEALYPPNAPPLGFVRNEPVYSRDCVHVCHSRDIWLKEAKVVKLGEKPYKIVKARPKYDKLSNTMITDQNLEIFGPWQVEDYDPPTAENGVVPRNAFGNVDLFKPSMIPKKCVHLQLPGLNKVARKMNIDCASAIVGFDFHGGWSHPVYDGFIVCEEYEDQLVAAWNIEQEEIERKEQEKYDKRVYGNWKKLIRGLLIKQRLKAKYGFGEEKQETSPGTSAVKNKSSGSTSCSKKRRVISDSSESENDDKK